MKKKSKTKYLVGTFLATALLMGGCFSDDEAENSVPAETQQNLAGQRLTDDNGVEYTLIDNGDGTETARYDDGRSVTFRRQEDGSLDFLSGTAGLIAGMAAGYFMFHGFSSPAGNWNAAQNRYTVNEPLQRRDSTTAGGAATSNRNSTTQNSSTATNANSNTANSNSKVNLSTAPKTNVNSSSSNSSAKTGFGTAGARGGSSSAAS